MLVGTAPVRFGIVGDVPSGAFELERRSGQQSLDRAAATLVSFQRGVGEFLYLFKLLTAGIAFVLVDWH